MRHLYIRKEQIVFPMAGVLAAFGIFGACAMNAWAAPSSGESISDNIVVRDSAVTGAQIGGLVEGQEVTITGETTGSDGKKWYSVTFEKDGEEQDGWVRADLIDTTGSAAQDEDEDEDETEDAGEDADATEDADEDADVADTGEETADEDADTTEIVDGTVRIELANGYVDLADVPDEVAAGVSDRFVESECALVDGTVLGYQLAAPDALVSNDALLTNYYYLYGTNELGESGWYVYDASQDSLQKSILEMSYSLTDTAEAEDAKQESENDELVRMMIAALAVVCLLLLILALVFSARYRRLRSMLEREERLEERRARKGETKKQETQETQNDSREPEKNTSYNQPKEPVEIIDLDDLDDDDYEELLDRYQEEHMPPEESPEDADDLPEDTPEDADDLPEDTPVNTDDLPEDTPEEHTDPEKPLSENDDDGDDGDDDLEFL